MFGFFKRKPKDSPREIVKAAKLEYQLADPGALFLFPDEPVSNTLAMGMLYRLWEAGGARDKLLDVDLMGEWQAAVTALGGIPYLIHTNGDFIRFLREKGVLLNGTD